VSLHRRFHQQVSRIRRLAALERSLCETLQQPRQMLRSGPKSRAGDPLSDSSSRAIPGDRSFCVGCRCPIGAGGIAGAAFVGGCCWLGGIPCAKTLPAAITKITTDSAAKRMTVLPKLPVQPDNACLFGRVPGLGAAVALLLRLERRQAFGQACRRWGFSGRRRHRPGDVGVVLLGRARRQHRGLALGGVGSLSVL
jgi:hypothetical protein